MPADTILVTGGAGFIGSNFVLQWLASEASAVINLDKLTYAGNPANLSSIASDRRYRFLQGDICDRDLIAELLITHKPRAIIHLAAESHVDRSIHGPDDFVRTNVNGTFCLLEETRSYWTALSTPEKAEFRFLHVSTDEVFGSLGVDDPPFSELTAYAPNSPYSASKAASDHMVRAYHHTYGLPTLTTNCSNNYGPYQFPEKLIPLMILNALEGKPLPLYGDGGNVRDWIYVEDHCDGVLLALERGETGGKYNLGGGNELTNLEIVNRLCAVLEKERPARENPALTARGVARYVDLKTFVVDRPGHDRRYAIDATYARQELDWKPAHDFESGLLATVHWYLGHL